MTFKVGSSVDDLDRRKMEGSRRAPRCYTYAAEETLGMAASSCWSILGGTLFPSALYLVILIIDVIDVDQDGSAGLMECAFKGTRLL